MLTSAPGFLDHLPLSRAAWEYACGVHDGQTRVGDRAEFIEHPREVALLLDGVGAPDTPPRPGLHHYTESLRSLEAVIRHHPLVRELRSELAALNARLPPPSPYGAGRCPSGAPVNQREGGSDVQGSS